MNWLPLILGGLFSIAQGAIPAPMDEISNCLQKSGVPFDMKGSIDWNKNAAAYNARMPVYTPTAIAVPTTIPQIKDAVNCSRMLKIKVSAKAGGHSYVSGGLGGEHGHLVIQLEGMHNVTFNSTTNITTVQPGTRLGHLATELYGHGRKRAISHGTCPT